MGWADAKFNPVHSGVVSFVEEPDTISCATTTFDRPGRGVSFLVSPRACA
jgi:hypothetical protein